MEMNQLNQKPVSSMTAVNYSEMRISGDPSETLVAFSVGSGIALSIYDSLSKSGGILNFLLPDSSCGSGSNPEKTPFMYADTGIPAFLNTLNDMGADVNQMKIVLAGAAQIMGQSGIFNIGEKNYEAVKKIMTANNLKIQYEHVGGMNTRTLSLNIGDGFNTIKTLGEGEINI